MRERVYRFMQGRYGSDSLCKFLLIISVIFMLIATFISRPVIYYIGFAVLILTYYRMLSRNIQQRYAENQKYLQHTAKIRNWFNKQKCMITQRKVYHIYKCPNCKQKVRVPRGKGNIVIRCPKCAEEFQKRS